MRNIIKYIYLFLILLILCNCSETFKEERKTKKIENLTNRAFLLMDKEKYNEVEKIIDRIIKLDPIIGYLGRGFYNLEIGNYEKGIYYFTRVINYELDDINTKVLAYWGRGICYFDDKEKALIDFNEAIKLDSTFSRAYQERGLVYSLLRNYEKAIDDFNEAIRIDPNNANFYKTRAVEHILNYNYELGFNDISKSISIDPNNSEFFYIRSMSYNYQDNLSNLNNLHYNLNNYYKAKEDMEMAIKLSPDNNKYLERLDWINNYIEGLLSLENDLQY